MGQDLKVGKRPVDDMKAFAFREPLGYFEQRNEIIYLRFGKGHAVRNRLWNGKVEARRPLRTLLQPFRSKLMAGASGNSREGEKP